MSQAVINNGVVYLAGQVAKEGEDVETQTRSVLGEIDRLLALAGTNKSRLLTATIWLVDIGQFAAMNKVWDAWVDPKNTPARATGEVKLAAPKYLVEIIVSAALP
jgi:enamine deaminase RidA (YjgF/YER057c/UK114 family)